MLIIMGNKYFIFLLDIIPVIIDKIKVESNIKNTIPIASVGPAKSGNI